MGELYLSIFGCTGTQADFYGKEHLHHTYYQDQQPQALWAPASLVDKHGLTPFPTQIHTCSITCHVNNVI